MQKPHEFVLNKVQYKWSYESSKGFWGRLFAFGANPVAIDIIETESLDEEEKCCTGEILNKWRYDDKGLQILPEDMDMYQYQYKVEKCWYCLDRENKRLVITWAYLRSYGSNRNNSHYFHDGFLFEIIEKDGIEKFKGIGCWIE